MKHRIYSQFDYPKKIIDDKDLWQRAKEDIGFTGVWIDVKDPLYKKLLKRVEELKYKRLN